MKRMVYKNVLGTKMIAWLEAVYREPQAIIQVNDRCSGPVKLSRGVRQGCPLSPLLFKICLQALAIVIKRIN